MTAAANSTAPPFPVMRLFTPSDLYITRTAQQRLSYDNPFGFTWQQALRSDAVLACARQMALDCAVDARAQLVVETLLRWKLSETCPQQHVMLEHRHLTSVAGDDRAAIGDGLLMIACCQIIPSNEAYATYRELFTDQPITAATGLVTPPASTTTAQQKATSSTDSVQAQFAARYGKAGEQFYADYSNTYPVTTAALTELPAAAESGKSLDLSDDEAHPAGGGGGQLSDDDDDNDMSLDAAHVEPPPPLPPVMHDARLLAWHDALIRSQKCRIRIVLRGYISRAVVRSAARLNTATGCMYVLDSSYVCSDAASALGAEPFVCDSAEASSDSALSPQHHQRPANNDDDDNDDNNADIELFSRSHLLDRLDDLALDQLTHYELDKAMRHRFNLHATLYSYWHANRELDTNLVRTYPRGFDAPVLQRFKAAPGLLSTATHLDYAAIGLAGLCILAAMSAPFRQWLLDVEGYYYRAAVEDDDPTVYLSRIDNFISRCLPPPAAGALRGLLLNVLDTINRKIKEIDGAVVVAARPSAAAPAAGTGDDDNDNGPIDVDPSDDIDAETASDE